MRLDRLTTLLVLIIFLAPFVPSTPAPYEFTEISEVSARDSDNEVSEVFSSPNELEYRMQHQRTSTVQWIGITTVSYGKYSDQFIELWNTGSFPVNVSNWKLSVTSGSPPCQLAWNTVIDAGDRIVIFGADSDIYMSYFDGETISITGYVECSRRYNAHS